MSKELQIRNSTVDFLVFTRDAGEDGIESGFRMAMYGLRRRQFHSFLM